MHEFFIFSSFSRVFQEVVVSGDVVRDDVLVDARRFLAGAPKSPDLVCRLVAEVERLRGELPVELDEDFGWIDRDGNFWSYDDINTWQWWVRPPGCDSGAALPLAKHGPFRKGRWDYDLKRPVAL